jgi:hypothetical protein
MNSVFVVLLGFGVAIFGYRVYAKYVSASIPE